MKKRIFTSISLLTLIAFVAVAANSLLCTALNGEQIQIQSIDFVGNDVEVVPQSGSTLNSLIDGDRAENADTFATEGVVLFKNNKATSAGVYTEFSLTLKLQEESSVGGAVISFYKEYNSMIGLPKDNSIIVEYSNDGTAFLPVGTYTFEGQALEETNEVQDAKITFNGVVNAAFIRLTFAYGDSPFTADDKVVWEWIGMTEVALTGAIDNVPDESDTSEPTDESDQVPPTGEEPMWLTWMAAALALSGIIIAIIRMRNDSLKDREYHKKIG